MSTAQRMIVRHRSRTRGRSVAIVVLTTLMFVPRPAYASNPRQPAGANPRAVAHLATKSSSVQVIRKEKAFTSCDAAGAWLTSTTEAGVSLSDWLTTFKAATVKKNGSVWTARTTATSTYRPERSSITITVPVWSPMTAVDHAAVLSFTARLLAHEEGHQKLARDNIMIFKNIPVVGAGESAAAAISDLDKEKIQFDKDVKKYIDAKEDEYDRVTAHGAKQSAVGGKDVVLICHHV